MPSREPPFRLPCSPEYGCEEAHYEIKPDSGNGGCDARPFASENPDLGRVTKEAGSKIHQAKTHSFYRGPKVLAYQPVRSLMKRGHRSEQEPEFDQVPA